MSKHKDNKLVAEVRNPKASRDYDLRKRFEAGLVLKGTEVKSLREGRANIADSFVRIDYDNRPTLYHAHIAEYGLGNTSNHNPYRPRHLLLHAKEVRELREAVQAGGMSIVPLKIYFFHGLAKITIALGKGKKLYDKRADIKKREAKREIDRALRRR
ncbi:MAG: SsrA-binding protein SmpB [Opitutales bacterium]|nr:SsrA-binding protein SmpB [Opitutales bacterium]